MIKAKRIYEPAPKKEEQVDLQKIIADAFQSSISKAEKTTTGLSLEIEKENKIIDRIFYRIEDKLKSMKIDKSGVTEDVYNQISSSLQKLGSSLLEIVNNHEHDYLTSDDKDECIAIAETMVNEAVAKFDSLIKPFEDKFLEYLEGKSNTDHSHSEFEEIREEIEENEKELEEKLGKKADINHTHKIDDIESLTDMLNKKADKEHNHDNYATREELNFLSMQRARGAGGGGHVIQGSGVVSAQRSNLNFVGATVSDDPSNNATVVTITGGGTGGVQSIIAGTNITVDNTDPENPIVSATGGSGSGDVVGPASATDGAFPLYDGATGKIIKNSAYTPASFAAALTSDENYVTDAQLTIISATTASFTTTDEIKLDNITVTQPVDLDQMEADIAALANGMVYKGNWDASVGTFPGAGVAQTGWFYTVSVGGTVDSIVFNVDDRLVSTVDNASTTIYAGNWTKLDATDAVTSVNGAVGNVLVQSLQIIVSSSQTAVNDEVYTVVASSTFTDPSPVEGKGYKVVVRNGTATIGGIGYSVAGSEIIRIFHSGAWSSYLKTPCSGVNTGDQTSIVGITGTIAQFNTACTDADFATLAGSETLTNKSVNGVTLVTGGTATKYLSEDGTYTTPAGGGGATLSVRYSLTGTYASTSTFTFSGDAGDAEDIERSLFTCLSSADARKIGYVKSASHSAGTVTVTVVTDIDLASGDKTFKVAINRKVEDYEKLVTIPGEQVADASNPQGMFYRSLVDTYLLPVNSFVRTAAAGAGAACAWNVYKGTTNLFTSAQDMTTNTTFDEKRPNTNTITSGDIVTLRVTSSAGATNKASDLQVQLFIIPQTLFTTAD